MLGPLEAARSAFAGRDPAAAASACGFEHVATPAGDVVTGTFVGRSFELGFPSFEAAWLDDGTPVPPHILALVLYHLATADGTPPRGSWISFAELPAASFYAVAWRGYTPDALMRHFGDRVEDLRVAATSVGCDELGLPGDFAAAFILLPRLPVAVTYWRSDDEFSARADVLFDANAYHQLPTDCCAILSKLLVGALIAADPSSGG